MRHTLPLVLLTWIGSSPAHSQQPSPSDPRTLVDRGIEALGGLERLRAISGLVVSEIGHEYMVATPIGPTAPLRMIAQSITQVRDHGRNAIRSTMDVRFPMRGESLRQTSIATAVAGMAGARPDSRAGWVGSRAELALAPERLLLTARAAADLRLVRPGTIGFLLADAEIEVGFDPRSGLPIKVRRLSSDPGDFYAAILGDVSLETTWSSWALESFGAWYPRMRSVTLNGEPFREYLVTSLAATDLPADSTTIPDSVAARFSAVPTAAPAIVLDPRLLDDRVVLYHGGYQSFAVRQEGGIVIVEAPQSAAKSRAILADLAARWPKVPITAVVSTSPMWTHIAGIREYVARSIPVYATPGVGVGVRRLLATPHRLHPDSLARSPRRLRLTTVNGAMTVGTGAHRLDLRPAIGPHGQSMLLVMLPARRLLYASDVLVPDSFEPVFKAGYRREAIRTVETLGLSVDTVFALHLAPMAWNEVVGGVEIKAAR